MSNVFDKLIEKARHTTAVRFLYSLGIPNIGLANAKLIVANYKGDISAILNATKEELVMIDGIGDIMAEGYVAYMKNEANLKVIKDLLMVLDLEVYQASTKEQILEGITFCITGAVHYYANRDVFKEVVESLGGKVTGSVSKKTHYLVNNDITSTSGKNKKAKDLNIPIITEDMFVDWVENGIKPE